jgi:hypothetical protein
MPGGQLDREYRHWCTQESGLANPDMQSASGALCMFLGDSGEELSFGKIPVFWERYQFEPYLIEVADRWRALPALLLFAAMLLLVGFLR